MKKAIKITEEIKTKNKRYRLNFVESNQVNKIVNTVIPDTFFVTEPCSGGYKNRIDIHTIDGWKTPVVPDEFDSSIHILGDLEQVGDDYVFTYTNKTDEQIQQEQYFRIEQERQEAVALAWENQLNDSIQSETDVETILNNQNLYPLWKSGLNVSVGEKYQHFGDNNEMWLWEVIQAHTTQSDWEPSNVPNLFKRVAMADEYLVWVQPVGAHDAYQIDDIVWYPTEGSTLYISTATDNVWVPGVFGWEVYVPKN